MRGVLAIVIGIILLITGIGIYFYYTETTVNAEELCENWNIMSGTFKSYDSGDEITIIDEINDIEHLSNHMTTGEPVDWTIITLKSVDLKVSEITQVMSNPQKIWGLIIFNGDITDDFKEGDKVEIKVKVITYEILGQTAEILEWYEDLMDAALSAGSGSEDISYNDLKMADPDNISHGHYYYEISIGIFVIIGIIILIIGIVQAVRARKARRMAMYGGDYRTPYPPSQRQPENGYSNSYYGREQYGYDSGYQVQNQNHFGSEYPRGEYQREQSYDKEQRKFMCPKCGNVMYLTVPYTPYKVYCDNCGIAGRIQ
jgi:hypothetical protein